MAQAYAAFREGNGHGRTDAFAASEMPSRPYDVVVALSRSGTTTEVAHALMRSARSRTVAITAVPDSPVAHAADEVVELEFADEKSVVQTRFATTALSLLRAHEGLDLAASIADAAHRARRRRCRSSRARPTAGRSSAAAGPSGWPARRR